jgi:hypothetical protein
MPTHTLTRRPEQQGTEDLKSTLVQDLCQGILETPYFDAAVPPDYESLRAAFEDLHDVATTLAKHLTGQDGEEGQHE